MTSQLRGRTIVCFFLAIALPSIAASARASRPTEDAWLADLQTDVRADIAARRPVVVQVHVPLCDNTIIRCGGRGRGDGDDLRRNLYWATSEGLDGWMARRGSGWTPVTDVRGPSTGNPDVLEVRVWRRDVPLPRAWAAAGMPSRFTVHLVAFAWRGTAIDRALAAYVADLYGDEPRVVMLPDGSPLAAGGAARLVAWVGHNRLMDVTPDWKAAATLKGSRRKGTLAVACYSGDYWRPAVDAPTRVPLLMTKSFVMASSPALENGVMSFFAGSDLAAIRLAGAEGYAIGQQRPVEKVRYAFINPADRRW